MRADDEPVPGPHRSPILTEDKCPAEEKESKMTPFLPWSTDLPPKTPASTAVERVRDGHPHRHGGCDRRRAAACDRGGTQPAADHRGGADAHHGEGPRERAGLRAGLAGRARGGGDGRAAHLR